MHWFKGIRISLFRKQLFVIVGINILSLALVSGLLYSNFVHDYKDNLVGTIQTELVLLSFTSSSALLFEDKQAATTILSALERDPKVRFAQIYDAQQTLFAEYVRDGQFIDFSIQQLPISPFFSNDNIYIYMPIELDQQTLGSILISTNTEGLEVQQKRYAVIVILIFLFSLFIAYILNWKMQKKFTSSFSELFDMLRVIAKDRIYYKRLTAKSDDEVGDLCRGVNSMLDTIEEHEKQLNRNSEQLKAVVDTRTEELFNLANYDYLTKLPHRELLAYRIDHGLHNAYVDQNQLALLFIDLNRFKVINENLGRGVGDTLLKLIAKRLTKIVGNEDNIARWGGDKFIVLLEDLAERDEVKKVAEQIIEELRHPINIDENQLYVSASIGISVYPEHGDTSGTLLKHAEMCMYKAKEMGLGQYAFFQQEMMLNSAKHLAIEKDLRKALENDEFFLVYQPQICANTQNIAGVEALIRWNKDGQVISPFDFLLVAEDLGLMYEISLRVLQEACRQNKQWQLAGLKPIHVAVNLSVSNLMCPEIVDYIEKLLVSCELDPKWLEVEITEDSFVSSTESIIKVLSQLKSLGIKVAIDDFGTGYSCMSYLRDLPISVLKIDGSFIRSLGEDKASDGIVQSIITLGKSLNLQLVGECAETQQQVDMLQSMECDSIQGYFYSKPLTALEMTDYLSKA